MSARDQSAGAVVPDDTGGVAIRGSNSNDDKACGRGGSFRRLVKEPSLYSETPIRNPDDVVQVMAKELALFDREAFCVLNMNTNGRYQSAEKASNSIAGTLLEDVRERIHNV